MCTTMSSSDAIDISQIRFASTVFPTDDDMKLWNSLSAEEQRAVIMRKVESGLNGAPAAKSSKLEIMAEVLADLDHEV